LTHYHQVVFTTGAGADRRLGVPMFQIAQRDRAALDIIVRASPA
jgi:NADPH-dependent glutamate synthase beta subunit-like oxidoreductase